MLRFALLWLLVRVAGRLPSRWLYGAADAAGTLGWLLSSRLRGTTRDHMRHVLSGGAERRLSAAEVDRAASAAVRSAARYYADFARSSHLSPQQAFDEVEHFEGINHLFAALDRGCGVIMASAHLGSPEYIFHAASYLGLEMVVLTEPLEPQRVHDFVHEVRAAPGVRFVPADRDGLRETLAALRGGRIAAVLADRDIQGAGQAVTFFGERASLPAGPVQLALRTGASILPVFGTRTGTGRYDVVFRRPLELQRSGDRDADLAAGMRMLAQALEQGIAAAPGQWFVLQPVWTGLAQGRGQAERGGGGDRTLSGDEHSRE